MSIIGSVGKKSLIFGIGRSISALATIVAIPIYSRLIEPHDYGIYAIINGILLSVIVLAGCGLSSSVIRFYHELPSGDVLKGIIPTQFISAVIFSIVGFAVLPALRKWNLDEYGQLTLAAIPLILLENFIVIQLSFYRIRQQAWHYAIVSVFQRWIGIGLTIFLLMQQWGVISLFIGLIVADLLLVLYFIATDWKKYFPLSLDVVNAKNFLFFGIPIAFDSLVFSVFQLSDRYILGMYHSLTDVGIYSFIYDISLKAQFLIVLPMTQVIEPMFWSEQKKIGLEGVKQLVSNSTQYYFVSTAVITGFVLIYSDTIIRIFGSDKYVSHELLLPILTLGLLLYGVFYIVRIGIFYGKKTGYLFVITSVVAILKIILNIFIIPHYGVLAAAWSTLLGYVILTIAAYWFSNRFIKIRYSFLKNSIGVVIVIIVAYGIALIPDANLLWYKLGKGIFFLIFSGTIFLFLFKNLFLQLIHAIKK